MINIEEHQKTITQNINHLIKLEQGKSEILKILESATDNEYYYNCKKRKGFFDNNFNKRLQNHIKSSKTIIKTYNSETREIAIETNKNTLNRDEKAIEYTNKRQKEMEESSRIVNKLIDEYHESVIDIPHTFQEFLTKKKIKIHNSES